MTLSNLRRRAFLTSTILSGAALALPARAQQHPKYGDSTHTYEVIRTKEEWLERLSEYEFSILRMGGTEWPDSSDLAKDYSEGSFACKGCDLDLYTSEFRVKLDKGWVFFSNALTDTVLTGIDRGSPYVPEADRKDPIIETHCRRCGSHLGHIVLVAGKLVHCINGTSLVFTPQNA